jgi:hypothetical protein
LPPHYHRLWCLVGALLPGFQHALMLPTFDPPFAPGVRCALMTGVAQASAW